MERAAGWKPMPIVFKIIWILLVIGFCFSLVGVFSAAQGYTFMGINLYGKWATNTMFFVNLVLPIVLIIAMIRRFKWTWIYAIFAHLFFVVNGLLGIKVLDSIVTQVMATFPPELLDTMSDPKSLFYGSALTGVILGALVDTFFMLMFIIKRKYFMAAAELPPMQQPENKD